MFKYVKFNKVEDKFTTHEFRGGDDTVKVNNFTGANVVSVEADVEDDIDALIASQEDVISCTVIEQDEFKALVQDTAQLNRIREVVKESLEKDMRTVIEAYPLVERETWTIQYSEALKYLDSSDEDDAPFLKVLADADGSSLDDFANAVIAKKDAFIAFAAEALAKKRAFEKEMLSEIGL